jgi:hypothetical protein
MGLGLAVVCLTPDSPAAPAETVAVAKVETAPAPVRVVIAPRASVQVAAATPAPAPAAPQAQTRCSDPAYVFLNPACQTAVKRHVSRHHRSVTFVAGNPNAAPPAATVATAPTPPAKQQTATRTRPAIVTVRPAPADRPLSLAPPLKTAQQSNPAVAAQ